MNDFISNKRRTAAVKKSEIASVLLNSNYKDFGNTGNSFEYRTVLIFILKSGEKATIFFESEEEAQAAFDELVSNKC